MKKIFFSVLCVLCSVLIYAWNSPIPVPDLSSARLRVVAQNAANYIHNFEASNAKNINTQEAFDTKTNKIANAFLALQADIVAICEVEENDEILGYIVDAMNTIYGQQVYTYLTDGLYEHASAGSYQALKSGFIYRQDKVTPQGSMSSPYYSGEYNHRMRIQAFKEKSTGEVFVLSMNHFKAKTGDYETTQRQNVNNLISKLNWVTTDPDILVMGDLNAYMGEEPINLLENAGYEEQLVRFDPNAYTYDYYGDLGILDHCMANASMAKQITGAYAYHINTAGYASYKYSDHDAIVVGLRLGEDVSEGFVVTPTESAARKILYNGQLYIELDGQYFNSMGTKIQ